ncbi:hypothetical protein TNCV_4586261 [Trichonephila clavipes]|nr:hypothetical protein TNCV_4586261 [Trichonephila clavipes]
MTPELAPLFPNYHTNVRTLIIGRFKVLQPLLTVGLQWHYGFELATRRLTHRDQSHKTKVSQTVKRVPQGGAFNEQDYESLFSRKPCELKSTEVTKAFRNILM